MPASLRTLLRGASATRLAWGRALGSPSLTHSKSRSCSLVTRRHSGEAGAVSGKLAEAVRQGRLAPDADQQRAAAMLDRLRTIAVEREAAAAAAANTRPDGGQVAAEDGDCAVEGEDAAELSAASGESGAGAEGGAQAGAPPSPPNPPPLAGVYLWGNVGTGKTMLMDMFAEALGEADLPVIRVHFHKFMLAVHAKLHAFHQAIPVVTVETPKGLLVHRHAVALDEDPLEAVADVLRLTPGGRPARFLCFDELHVADVADAMLLARLFRRLMAAGTMVAFTSNQPPSALYAGGLAREYFLPFVDLLTSRAVVLPFHGATDYREQAGSGTGKRPRGAWLHGRGGAQQEAVLWQLEAVTGVARDVPLPLPFGRTLFVLEAAGLGGGEGPKAARFTFWQLCGASGSSPSLGLGGALGPNDLTALAEAFPVLHVTRVPAFTPKDREAVRRWVVALDCLYEAGTRLVCEAETSIEGTFEGLQAATAAVLRRAEAGERRPHPPSDPWERDAAAGGDSELEGAAVGALREEVLMYMRARSRLVGMCSEGQH